MGKTYQSIVVAAPLDKVWDTLKNFHDLSWAEGVVTKTEIIGDKKADQIGAQRKLNDVFEETLLSLDELSHTFCYSIDDGPGPVSRDVVRNYVGTVKVSPITEGDGGSFVQWSSRWEAKDDEAQEFCHGIYVALLAALKKHLE